MSRLKIAVEELSEDLADNCDVTECTEDDTATALEKDDQLISLQQDDLNQARDISDTLATLADNIDTSTGISDQEAKVLQVVTEHFRRTLHYKDQIVPSLESFNNDNRLQQSKLVLENLNQLNIKLNRGICVAQESIFDSIVESIIGIFSKEKELRLEVTRLKKEVKSKRVKTDLLPHKDWTRHLKSKSNTIEGKDVEDLLVSLKKYFGDEDFYNTVRQLNGLLSSIKLDVKDTWFKVNLDTLNRVTKSYNEVKELTSNFGDEIINKGVHGAKDLKPLTIEEIEKILDGVEDILYNKNIETEMDHLNDALVHLFESAQSYYATTPAMLAHLATAIGMVASYAGYAGAILASTSVAGMVGALGVYIVVLSGIAYLGDKAAGKVLPDDDKTFILILEKTIKEVQNTIGNYRELNSEKVKICSAALNYVKASVH